MTKYALSEQQVKTADVKKLTKAIEPLFTGHTKATIIVTCLTIATLIQESDIEPKRLQEVVTDLSRRIAFLLEDTPDTIQ